VNGQTIRHLQAEVMEDAADRAAEEEDHQMHEDERLLQIEINSARAVVLAETNYKLLERLLEVLTDQPDYRLSESMTEGRLVTRDNGVKP
jgi:hypothetical protein